jgi:hypothetical protein
MYDAVRYKFYNYMVSAAIHPIDVYRLDNCNSSV